MKNRLRPKEKSSLRGVAETLVRKEDIIALCAYGSRVAGCAREDSDCDLLIVAKDFKEGTKSVKVQGRPAVSALVVDEAVLRKEAGGPTSKELVVGRLLNVYEPLVGSELLRSVELEYKRRVIAESLTELQSEYGGFSSDLIIPYEY
ncbi:MAG: nucleotidyltransferase domain-containing protein, partial [Nitrososphaerales archaeon]